VSTEPAAAQTDAYLESDWSLSGVLAEILESRVPTVRVAGLPLFDSLLVHLPALREAHPFYKKESMSVKEAAVFLAIGETTVSRLVFEGILPSQHTRSVARFSKMRRSILRDDLVDFAGRYITLSEVWRDSTLPLIKVRKWLNERRLKPVEFSSTVRCTMYLRREVEPHLQHQPKT